MADEIKLNRQKSYGTVYGDPRIGFVQDGHEFRHDGTLYSAAPVAEKAAPEPVVSSAPVVTEKPTAKPQSQSQPQKQESRPAPQPPEEVGSLADRSAEAQRRSEKMRQIWMQRRAAQEAADAEAAREISAQPAAPALPPDDHP